MIDHKMLAKNRDQTIWQRFTVPYEFPVCFTSNIFAPENLLLSEICSNLEPSKRHKLIIFIDKGVVDAKSSLLQDINHYFQTHDHSLELLGDPIIMPPGEILKSNEQYIEQMQKSVFDYHVDRHSFIVGIGGGALLDAVGLVAATAHRGIRHIRIPTSVLAQNDSGVGVKNGINLFGQKNYFGTFSPPFAVINDYEFIRSLPARDKISGMAEAVKVALIRDRNFYDWLESQAQALSQFDQDAMQYMIKRCAELHMHQISNGGDPFENGSARPLDFGHWAAHRLETLTQYEIRHGEAVAIGLALDTQYSTLCGLLDQKDSDRVCELLEKLGFKLWHSALETKNDSGDYEIMRGLVDFREHLGGLLTITLLNSLGTSEEVNSIDEGLVLESLYRLKKRQLQSINKSLKQMT